MRTIFGEQSGDVCPTLWHVFYVGSTPDDGAGYPNPFSITQNIGAICMCQIRHSPVLCSIVNIMTIWVVKTILVIVHFLFLKHKVTTLHQCEQRNSREDIIECFCTIYTDEKHKFRDESRFKSEFRIVRELGCSSTCKSHCYFSLSKMDSDTQRRRLESNQHKKRVRVSGKHLLTALQIWFASDKFPRS